MIRGLAKRLMGTAFQAMPCHEASRVRLVAMLKKTPTFRRCSGHRLLPPNALDPHQHLGKL